MGVEYHVRAMYQNSLDNSGYCSVDVTLNLGKLYDFDIEHYFTGSLKDFGLYFYMDDGNTKIDGDSEDPYGYPYRVCTDVKAFREGLEKYMAYCKEGREYLNPMLNILKSLLKTYTKKNFCSQPDSELYFVLSAD